MTDPVLRVNRLKVRYQTPRGPIKAVEDVSFSLEKGEKFGLVGESGSGKTTTALALMRLLNPPAAIESGEILLEGQDLLALSDEEMRRARGAGIALVPQGAMNSLNPVMRVRDHFAETLRAHGKAIDRGETTTLVAALLGKVGLLPEVADRYPHELSGGMKQRVIIAISIALQPAVIVADEPTSALDVVVQMQVMATLDQVQKDIGAAVILVGHDMGLMAQFCNRIGVMYAGALVESAPVSDLFRDPKHPYTRLLISSLPSLEKRGDFKGIPGLPPSLRSLPPGCTFHPRCPRAFERCRIEIPADRLIGPGRRASCHLHDEAAG